MWRETTQKRRRLSAVSLLNNEKLKDSRGFPAYLVEGFIARSPSSSSSLHVQHTMRVYIIEQQRRKKSEQVRVREKTNPIGNHPRKRFT